MMKILAVLKVHSFKRPWDYNFTHFRYQNFGIVPEWFIVKFQAKNDYWAHPWSFKKSVLLVSSHPKASHPQIWKIFRKRKSQFLSSYYSSITVIFHVAYTYKSSKFFMKRPSSFIIKKSLVWRLRDFSSIANLPGCPVPELKSDLKIQIFISNLEDWWVKTHWPCYKNPPKNCVTFLGFEPCFQPSLFLPQWTLQSCPVQIVLQKTNYDIFRMLNSQHSGLWRHLEPPKCFDDTKVGFVFLLLFKQFSISEDNTLFDD